MFNIIERYIIKMTKEDINNFALSKDIHLSADELNYTYDSNVTIGNIDVSVKDDSVISYNALTKELTPLKGGSTELIIRESLSGFTKNVKISVIVPSTNVKLNKDKDNIRRIDEKLCAAKNYYNKNTSLENQIIRKFPTNVIAKIHKFKIKLFFDGKDMEDEIIDDFKI